MPHTLIPTTAADRPTLVPPDPDEKASSWIPAPSYWNAAPTMLLPPAKPEPPVPIPEGVYLIPTDMLPPQMLELAPREPSSIPPPPMIGPIELAPVSEAAPAPPSVSPQPPASVPSLPLAEYPLQRCAAIAACIAMRPTECAAILEREKLDATTWQALEVHGSTTVKSALRDGDPAPLRAYDAAYVSALERLRGPITQADGARIVAARGRGRNAEVLTALGIPQSAALHIQRVLLQRACSL